MEYELAHRHPGPSVVWMLVGAQLRRLREASGVTRERAGRAIRASAARISRIEIGRTAVDPHDIDRLLALYAGLGGDLESERQTLLTLARQPPGERWWQEWREVVPPWFEAYLDLEPVATRIRSFEVEHLPGLLQTREYARALIRSGYPLADEQEIDRRVGLRMRRQRILHRFRPPRLWAVIDETALQAGFADPATMCDQLRHLIDVVEHMPHVSVQILPFQPAGHSAVGGPVTLLRLAETDLPDVVYLEWLTGAEYPSQVGDIRRYRHILNRLAVEALPPRDSLDLLRRARDRITG